MRRDADGYSYFVGRKDDMINVAGENLYPKEVEDLLLRHPDLKDACVVPAPHAAKGWVPVAYVAARDPSGPPSEEAVKRFFPERGAPCAPPSARRLPRPAAAGWHGKARPGRAQADGRRGGSDRGHAMSGAIGAPAGRFAELKARQAVAWGAAPFERIADTMSDVHDRLVARLARRPGESWLDLATGTGPVALRAARAGATVSALDLAPTLIATARRLAAAESLAISFEIGDCERLPYPDGTFDVVASSLGVIFAPDHAAVASELARACRGGGRLGLACWRPGGGAAHMTGLVMSFHPTPPPPDAGNPFDWGREQYVSERLGDAFELEFVAGNSPHAAASAEAIWELYVTSAGPMKTLADTLEPGRLEELHRAFVALLEDHLEGGRIRFPREYLLVLGMRRNRP